MKNQELHVDFVWRCPCENNEKVSLGIRMIRRDISEAHFVDMMKAAWAEFKADVDEHEREAAEAERRREASIGANLPAGFIDRMMEPKR